MSDAISAACAMGLHHDPSGYGLCPGTMMTMQGEAPCECHCHAPHRRRR